MVQDLTGTARYKGTIVVIDTGTAGADVARAVTIVDAKKAKRVYGVLAEDLAANGSAPCIVDGPAEAALSDDNGDIVAGDEIVTSNHGSGGYGEKGDGLPVAGTVVGYAIDAQATDSVLGTDSSLKTIFVSPR